jgi:hypothetical protein
MSSYDIRTPVQIRIDELINRYKSRARDLKIMGDRFDSDVEILKQLNLLINDLVDLKESADKTIKG